MISSSFYMLVANAKCLYRGEMLWKWRQNPTHLLLLPLSPISGRQESQSCLCHCISSTLSSLYTIVFGQWWTYKVISHFPLMTFGELCPTHWQRQQCARQDKNVSSRLVIFAISLSLSLCVLSAVYPVSGQGSSTCSALRVTSSLCWRSMTLTYIILYRDSELEKPVYVHIWMDERVAGQTCSSDCHTRCIQHACAVSWVCGWKYERSGTYWGWWFQTSLFLFFLLEHWPISLCMGTKTEEQHE